MPAAAIESVNHGFCKLSKKVTFLNIVCCVNDFQPLRKIKKIDSHFSKIISYHFTFIVCFRMVSSICLRVNPRLPFTLFRLIVNSPKKDEPWSGKLFLRVFSMGSRMLRVSEMLSLVSAGDHSRDDTAMIRLLL